MKIVLIGRYGERDILRGPEKVAKNLFFHLSKVIPNSKFLTYFFKLTKTRKIQELLFGSTNICVSPSIRRLGILKLMAEIIRNKPDLLHLVTFERFEFLIVFLKIFLKFKLVYTVHGVYQYERKIFDKKPSRISDLKDILLEKLIISRSDKLVFLSRQMVLLTMNYYKIDESKVTIIPNGVSVSNILGDRTFNLSHGVEIIFYNGLDVSRERGLRKLIKILAEKRINNFNLSVLGAFIKSDFDKITYYDPMPDKLLFDFLVSKHVFVDNLDYMPFSILALEAMALGLILIVSDKSGISSYINSGENGFVYSSEKPEEIGIILNDIIIGKYNLNLLSSNAKKISCQLNWQKIADEYFSVYKKLL